MMKKLLSFLLACTLVCGCILSIASCSNEEKPNRDPKKAIEALTDAGYDVDNLILKEDQVGADGIEAYVEAIKIGGVDMSEITSPEELDGRNITVDFIIIIYINKDADVDKLVEEAKSELNDMVTTIADLYGQYIDAEVHSSKNMIWFGTEEAIISAK